VTSSPPPILVTLPETKAHAKVEKKRGKKIEVDLSL
jgi:hypothetical protein